MQLTKWRHGFTKYELDLMDAKAEGIKQGIIIGTIHSLQQFDVSSDKIIEQLTQNFDLTPTRAQEYYQKYGVK